MATSQDNLRKMIDEVFVANIAIPENVLNCYKEYLINTVLDIQNMVEERGSREELVNKCGDYLTCVKEGGGFEVSNDFVIANIPLFAPFELVAISVLYSQNLLPVLLAKSAQFFITELFDLIRLDHARKRQEEEILLAKLTDVHRN